MHTGRPFWGQNGSQAEGGGPKLTFGSEQRGIAGLVAEWPPVMLGRGAGVRAGALTTAPVLTAPPPRPRGKGAHLGMAPRRQCLAAALTLETELVPVLAQRAHLLSWGQEGRSGPVPRVLPWADSSALPPAPHGNLRAPPTHRNCLLPLRAPALLPGPSRSPSHPVNPLEDTPAPPSNTHTFPSQLGPKGVGRAPC